MSTVPAQPRRRTIDVSNLPDGAMDWRDPLWWGNTLMMLIETTTVALMLAGYYYLRRNYDVFPPPRYEQPVMYDTTPHRLFATIDTGVLLVSAVVAYFMNSAARAENARGVRIGLAAMLLLAAASLAVTWNEFSSIHFSWGDNAYASVCWTTIAFHFLYVLIGLCEFGLLLVWCLTHQLDEKHDLDVTLAGAYWYWVVGVWIPIYVTIWFAPSFLK
ncbi:MAG: cytochrome c oxidase subunit 3 [Tepidisphaeraceae bacterium]